MFFLKVLEMLSTFQKCTNNWEKAFCFLDNCIWIGCVNLSLLRREKLWPTVNVFTKSQKILHITKRDFFQFNCLYIDQQICQRCCGSNLNSDWARLPCCFSKVPHKRDFLEIHLTPIFRVRNLENTSAMRVIFFVKILKILFTFQKCRKRVEKKFSLLEIIAFQLVPLNCLY